MRLYIDHWLAEFPPLRPCSSLPLVNANFIGYDRAQGPIVKLRLADKTPRVGWLSSPYICVGVNDGVSL